MSLVDIREGKPIIGAARSVTILAAVAVAVRKAGQERRHIAVVRSSELVEQMQPSLERAGYERVEISPVEGSRVWIDDDLSKPRWDARELPEGPCFLRLVTVDVEGQTTASDPVALIITTSAPTCAFART